MRVDFPAPFSPRMPRTSPRRSVSETSSLAVTGPNLFVTPRISRTTGAADLSDTASLLRLVGYLDVAVYDPLLRLGHLVFDALGDHAVEAAERGQGQPVLLQAAIDDRPFRLRV